MSWVRHLKCAEMMQNAVECVDIAAYVRDPLALKSPKILQNILQTIFPRCQNTRNSPKSLKIVWGMHFCEVKNSSILEHFAAFLGISEYFPSTKKFRSPSVQAGHRK